MTQKSNHHLLAPEIKRMILKWVNDDRDPEEMVLHRDVAGVSLDRQEATFYYMRLMKQQVTRAFETKDNYDRDWFLFMARYYNAVLHSPFGPQLGAMTGVVPIAKNTKEDRALAFVQARLAHRMAVCKRTMCGNYFFRTSKGQQYCSKRCSGIVHCAMNLNWYHTSPNSRKNRSRTKRSPR